MTDTPFDRGYAVPPSVPQAPRQDRPFASPTYGADGTKLFWLAFRGTLLAFLTLGIYRFWLRTQLRRLYLGGINVVGDPLEYTGRGLEKLLGFLLAMVILALYLGIIQILVTFAGFSLVTSSEEEQVYLIYLSALATLPLIYFAQYRAMRYLLSRLRWRGIRFGLEPGALGFMVRALLMVLLSLVTAFLAQPYAQFYLARYVTNRARFGDQAFRQEGSWTQLIVPWAVVYVLILAFGVLTYFTFYLPFEAMENGAEGDPETLITGVVVLYSGIFVFYVAGIWYQYRAFQIIWSGKRLGDVRFESELSAGEMLGMVFTGFVVVMLATTGVGIAGVLLITGLALIGDLASLSQLPELFDDGNLGQFLSVLAGNAPILLAILGVYILMIAVVFAVGQFFFTHRMLRRQVETMVIHNPGALAATSQRAHDKAAEAGGFADALDVDMGAGF